MDTFNLRKFLKENKVKEATIINPEDLPGDEEGYITDDAGTKVKVRQEDITDSSDQLTPFPDSGDEAKEAPAHVIKLAIAAEEAYEEGMGIDEIRSFIEQHLGGAYGDY